MCAGDQIPLISPDGGQYQVQVPPGISASQTFSCQLANELTGGWHVSCTRVCDLSVKASEQGGGEVVACAGFIQLGPGPSKASVASPRGIIL